MKRRSGRPLPPKRGARGKLPARTRHTTVQVRSLPKRVTPPLRAPKPASVPKQPRPPRKHLARIVEDDESSLLDLLDNLLAKGVMLNADLILALANVDLVYVRLSALLCAADRVLPAVAGRPRV